MVEDWLRTLRSVSVNRYPDPAAGEVAQRLRGAMDLPPAAGVLLGNGSDELIQLLALTVGGPGRVVMAPEPSFVMYRMIAALTGMEYRGVPLVENFDLDLPAMLKAMERYQPALVFLAYPNNPTGNLFDPAMVRAIIEASPALVVVDEAYTAFAETSFLDHLHEYENLLILRTVSKLGLAGLRLGLLVGPRAWLQEVDKTRLPYNINVLTQVTAAFALRHFDVFEEQTAQIRRDRDALFDRLTDMGGIRVWPSRANFLLFRTAPGQARRVFEGLREGGILIKNLDGSHPQLADCLRVTVGTPAENGAFLEALAPLLGE